MELIERIKAWWRRGDQGEEEAQTDPRPPPGPAPDTSDVGPQPPED